MTFQPMSCIPTKTFYRMVMELPDTVTQIGEHPKDNNLPHGHSGSSMLWCL